MECKNAHRIAFLTMISLLLPLMAMTACSRRASPGVAAAQTIYFCPMHPQYTSTKPGDCPICGMRLVKREAAPAGAAASRKILYYRNPMNPSVTSPTPAKDNMGMDYVPVYSDEVSSSPVAGQAAVQVSPAAEQLIGVKVSSAAVRDLYAVVRASAKVAYDPGLYSAILEHQEAVRALTHATTFRQEAEATVRASRLRLRQMGLSDAQIERVSQPGFDPANLLLGGAGGTVWVYADLYEYETGLVRPGSRAELTSSAFPGRVFEGRVKAIDSVVNAETRTLRARIEVPNPNGELRPETYLNAVIYAPLGRKLSVPESAILDTGTRQLVFVQTGPGRYEPREVRVGREANGYVEIISGLREGDVVSTAANFLLDSESKLKAAVSQ